MSLVSLLVLLGTTLTVNGQKHSLIYIYMAFSKKPVGLPGLHEFAAMGLLDNRMIDYFDSDHQEMVPKQPWMKEKLLAEYWVKETQSRQSKQQWFKDNINILMKSMNGSDIYFQWMHGCEGEWQLDGRIKLIRSINKCYDCNDGRFRVAPDECIYWMGKFMTYQNRQLKEANNNSPPEVFLFTMNTNVEANIILTCLATGFYPKDIELRIKRNYRILAPEDGLRSTGSRPNGDDTFQRRDSVEILKSDESKYTCEVIHRATGVHVEEEWDHKLPPETGGAVIGAVVGGIVLLLLVSIGVILIVLYKKGMLSGLLNENRGSDPSLNSNESTQPLRAPNVNEDVNGEVNAEVNGEVNEDVNGEVNG